MASAHASISVAAPSCGSSCAAAGPALARRCRHAGGGGRRRTPGLRREEVAVLAGVGVSWYTWLGAGTRHQGVRGGARRDRPRAAAGPAERAHLYLLAGLNPPRARRAAGPPRRRCDGCWTPGHRGRIRPRPHWNLPHQRRGPSGVRLRRDRPQLPGLLLHQRPLPGAHRHWAEIAPDVAAAFLPSGALPRRPGVRSIADDLAAVSPEFAELWARHDVAGTPAR